MSRQEIEHSCYALIFGWDRAFDTYFAQVEDTTGKLVEDPLLWLGSERGEYRDVHAFEVSLRKGLQDIGIKDFELSEQQLSELQLARDENPPGTGIAEKNPVIRELMDIFREDYKL